MTQNVVTYTVVVQVDNTAGRLLPYLTARLQFEVERRKGVLLVPNAALRWQPLVRDVVPEAREKYALAQRRPPPSHGEPAPTANRSGDERNGLVWVRRGDFVMPIKARIGLSDGVVTEVSGEDVAAGVEIVVGANRIGSDSDVLSILPHTWSEPPKKGESQ
jgi:HlyD family secretion protein